MTGRRARMSLALGLTVLAASTAMACGSGADAPAVGAPPPTTGGVEVLPPPDPSIPTEIEPPTLAAFRRNADGVVLPDPRITAGTSFDDVTAADICDDHYTMGVRQPRFNDKVEAFTNYGISIHDRDVYAVDHLIPIPLGGNNTIENLWPQPYDDRAGADQKNQLERQLRGLVCSNHLTLDAAQRAIASDWWTAYEMYMGLPIQPGTAGPEPWRRHPQEEGGVVNGGLCEVEGEVGFTEPRGIRLTCELTSFGELRWQKRY